MNDPAILGLADVWYSYPATDTAVLRGLDAEFVANGSITAIVAPSGAGKTTLLAIVGGLLAPNRGRVDVTTPGRELTLASATAWVLQTTNALPRRTTLENAQLPLLARGIAPVEASDLATTTLAALGLSDVLCNPARTLSGGELQRLAIARALLSEAPFILADEPTGQLDDATTGLVIETVFGAVRSRAAGLLLVTHDRNLAERCDRILLLKDGTLHT